MVQPQLKLDLAPHERQLGKYRLLAKLGEGGMGIVYLALASGFGSFRKLLVVKELRRDLPWRESSLAMFMDEAQLAARLDHPNVLQTFEAGEADGRHFLAMEYLDGQPLSVVFDRARRAGGLPIELAVHVLCEVLSGLAYAHDLSDFDGARLHVVHRDVSPQNVFVTYHGQVKVVDFGVAKASNSTSLTSPGMFKGKFAYAAPEQLLGRPVDGRCDVFAVGVMLWEAMSGRRFSESTPSAPAFRTRTSGQEPRIRQLVPQADSQLADICDRALQVEADDRFENADAMRVALETWLNAHGGHVQPAQLGQRMRELFSEDRKQHLQVIEESMLEAGATHSVMQQLPVDAVVPAETRPATRAPAESGTSFRTPSSAREHEHEDPPPVRTQSAAPSPEHPRVPKPGAHSVHTSMSARFADVKPQPKPQPKAAKPRASEPKPPWASAAILCALALAVFVLTYKLSSSVATTTSVSAATSGTEDPVQLPPSQARAQAPQPQAPSLAATELTRANAPSPEPAAPVSVRPREDVAQPLTQPLTIEAEDKHALKAQQTSRPGQRAASQALRGADGQGVQPPSAASKQPSTGKSEQGASGKRQPVLRVRNDPGLGSDLRELRRNSPMRNIDVEDPYQ